ncbi:MAG: glycosyltransferase [Candidatus Bathyarchaeia archaeon]
MVKPKLSVIIPAYNEEDRIIHRLLSINRTFSNTLGNNYEVIVVMDGCTDNTVKLVSAFIKALDGLNVVALSFSKRLGKGGAIIKGLERASGENIIITDADDSVQPEDLLNLAKHLDNSEVVIGSRYVKDAKVLVKETFLRFLLGRAFNAFVKLFFWRLRAINDTQCGAKAIRKHAFSTIKDELIVAGFAFDINLIYSTVRRGFKVKEVGITWRHVEKSSKVSKALLKLIIGMFFSLVRLRLYYSKFRPILLKRPMKRLSTYLFNLTKA